MDEDKAKDFLGYCRFWCEQLNKLTPEPVVDLSKWTKFEGHFPDGSRVLALSSNPNAVRSQGGDVTLDEFAFHEDPAELYDASQPCLLWHPDSIFEVISSVNGVTDEFWRLSEEAKSGKNRFSYHSIRLDQAVEEGLALKIWKRRIPEFRDVAALNAAFLENVRSGCRTLEAYEREYLCIPALSANLVRPEEFDACAILKDVPEEPKADKQYNALYVGIDCGRSNDLTDLTLLEMGIDRSAPAHLSNVYRYVAHKTMWNTPFPIQEKIARRFCGHRALCGGLIDIGSVGRGLAESVRDETGSIVDCWAFTAPRKAAMAERVRQYFQQRRIAVPNDPKLKADICCVTKTQSKESGAWKYEGRCADSHGDRFWALALALEAAEQANPITLGAMSDYQPAVAQTTPSALPAPAA